MEYAPVIIPTLNRYEHLKRCIDSLSHNPLAKETVLIISVDYPPQAKYEEGYAKVVELLNSYDFSVFKDVDITYQCSNLGAKENTAFLFEKARAVSKTAIYSEDDNEFAPVFLKYINKSLEKFDGDSNVVFICGAVDTDWAFPEGANVAKTKFCPSYGTGVWLDYRHKFIEEGTRYLLDKKNWTYSNFCHLYKRNRYLFSKYICDILLTERGLYWSKDGSLNFCDVPKAIYMHLTDYVCISPLKPVSRTFGNDGSGSNMPAMETVRLMELDQSNRYELKVPDQFSFDSRNYAIGEKFLCDQYLQGKRMSAGIVLAIFGAVLLLVCGKNRGRAIKIMNKVYKLRKK